MSEKDYKKSLWPPGSDISLYTYDPSLYWHVTPDKIWWYRPDLTLWYDCRSSSYYTYDSTLTDYISVDSAKATAALAQGLNVSPEAEAMRHREVTVTELAAAEEAAVAETAAVAAPSTEENRLVASAGGEAGTTIDGKAGMTDRDGGELTDEVVLDAEDNIALQLRSHTESWQGKKDTQEDRYIQTVRMGRLGTAFGVFDGHGGVQSAEYAGKHLPNNVIRCHQQRSATRRDGAVDSKRILGALEEAFPLTDRELLSQARRKGFADGTTALFLLFAGTDVDDLTLFTAHVGDCRAVLCRAGTAVRLTQDHRPDRRDEQKRIKEAGGGVFQVSGIWRCTSAAGAARALDARAGFKDSDSHLYLSCSRTLGDPELKLNVDRPILSNIPEVSAHKLLADDMFIVLACDGVWDVLEDQQVVDIVLEHWGDSAAAASSIVRKALSTGSGDNLTAQVISLSWKHEQGVAVAKSRAEQKIDEMTKAKSPPQSPHSDMHPCHRPSHPTATPVRLLLSRRTTPHQRRSSMRVSLICLRRL